MTGIYNKAIAKNDTEAIYNSVIILFIMEIDEKVFEQIKQYNEDWINKITKQNREPERNVLLEGSDQCQDTLGTRVSSTESESCLPNSPLLPNIT